MKKILSVLITAVMLFSIALPAFAAIPLNSSNAAVHFESLNITVDPLSSAELTLVIEGLGTDPGNNQIGSIAFSSSNDSVNIPANCSPSSGSATSEGLAYQITASAESAGIATVTANVVDTNGNTYTCSCFVTVRGIVAQKKNVTLEVGETCIVFAKRYGLTEAQASKDMTWSKNGANSGWISLGTHGTGRQNEAYFIKGLSEGTGTVTVSLSGTGYSDTIAVSVVPKNAVTIEQDGTEVTSAIDLTSVSSASLDAVWEGFINPTVTWESSHPELVSVSQSGSSAVVSKISSSDIVVAVKATATENDITRTKTVYVNIADSNTVSLKITASKLSDNSIKIKQGETLTLSASALGLDPTATVWSATTEGGRVPLKLNSTVGSNITITGRLASSSPITVTASNGSLSDTVYVSVAPSTDKSVKITGADLNADGFIVMTPENASSLTAELNGFSDTPEVTWTASIAKNSENSTGAGSCPVIISNNTGLSTLVTAVTASADFAKIQISVTDDGVSYTDEVYVKVNEFNIVNSARYVTMFQNNVVTLSTANGETADWTSNSQKTYFGNVSKKPTYATGSSAAITAKGVTMNPSRITIQQNGNTDSVYVLSASGSWKTVSFNLNGGYGKVPGKVTMSSNDTYQSIILQNPDAAYPSDNGEYIFYGWSDKANAAQPNSTGVMYFAGEKYTVPSNQNNVTLYAIWVKKTESALFTLRLSGDIGAEPSGHPISDYAKSSVYIEDALDPAGFYFNVNGVESHLAKVPSDEDIIRALSTEYENGAPLTYNPDTDKIIWYVVKRTSDDSAGIANWHVDGVLVRGGRFSVSYNKNVSIANVTDFPNPPRLFYNEGDNVPITDLVPSCNDYRFIGWNTQPDGRGQWYTSTGTLYNGFTTSDTVETSFIIDKDTVLYAVWDGRMYYDVNEDGTEDINDIGFVISASAGLVNKKDSRLLNADFNGDGVVDGFDAAWLDRMFYSLGIISSSVELPQTSLTEITPVTVNGITPDSAIELTTAQTLADIDGKEYADWDIDLVITFNKTVNKNDIYLFGQYGEYDWTGDKLADSGSISANEEYSVIHTWLPAALGRESFALTYTDIVSYVKNFKCAIYANNPSNGLEVTVKLVATETNGTVHVLDTFDRLYTVLPKSTLTEITPVTVNGITPNAAIELTTVQTLADIEGKEYADWDIDFVLTFNKTVNKNDIYLFGQYGEYDWTGDRLADSGSISANEEYSVIHTWLPAALGKESFALTYTDIVSYVQDFKCSIYANNPAAGLEATVKLVATETNGTVHVIDTYTYSF